MSLPPIPIHTPSDNVIPLKIRKRDPGDLPSAPVQELEPDKRRKRPLVHCTLHSFKIDKHYRIVTCSTCERSFDHLEALVSLADNWHRYDINHRAVRREIADLTKKRDALTKQVTNLKAQAKRAMPVCAKKAREASELFHEAIAGIAGSLAETDRVRIAKSVHRVRALLGEVIAELEGREVSP